MQEVNLTRRTYGILAGLIGVGAWWWARQRTSNEGSVQRGRVIYHNTPEPTALSGEGVI